MANAKSAQEAYTVLQRLQERYPTSRIEAERVVLPANQWREEMEIWDIYEMRTCEVCGGEVRTIAFGEVSPEGDLCEECRQKAREEHARWMQDAAECADREAREYRSFEEWCS